MKRKLSLLLAVVMILSSFSFVFADEDFNVPAFLKKNGILVGNDDGDLMLDENLLRKDSVVLFARLLGKEAEAESFEMEGYPTFTDLAGNPYYDAFLAWAEYNEYFVGRPDGSFGYNDNLEAIESAIVLLRALGYTEEAADWDNAWETAKKLGLLKDIEVERRDLILREDVAQMIFNALSVTIKDSDKTLAEFLGIDMPEPEVLEVVDVYADNLKEIKIELNNAKLVDVDEVEDARNYRTDAGEVVDAKLVDNTIILTLKGEMRQNRKYELTTRYIKGVELDKEVFTAYDNEAPAVEEVTVLGTKGIRVRMTEPVTGAKEKDFKLDGKNFVMRVKHYGRDILLLPYREDGTFAEGEHELTIGSLEDYAGFKSKTEVRDIVIEEDTTKPEVAKVIARNNSVIVEFVEEVHPDSVSKKNVSWTEVRGRKATEADDFEILAGNKIEYKFGPNKELPKPAATITITGLENYSGYVMDKYEAVHEIEVDFSRPEIVDFKFVEKNVMEIEFNKVLDEKTAEDVDNYTLNEYKVADKEYKVTKYAIYDAELKADGKTVKVTFRDGTLTEGNKYRLDVSGIRDNTTLRNTMIADELEFTYGIGEGLKVVAVRERGKERIILEFNKDLVRREAEDIRNYEFELEDEAGRYFRASDLSKDPSVYLYGDGRTVEINLPGNGRAINIVHLGSAISALDGNRLDAGARVVALDASYLEITKATLSKDGKKLTVEFNQEITKKPEAKKVILAGTAGDLTIDLVKGNLEITGFTGVPTKVKIEAGSAIETKYEENKIARQKDLSFDDITDNRGLAVDVLTAKLDGSELTITIVLNKAIDGKQEEEIDVLINGKFYKTLGKAVRKSSTEYEFVVADQADAKKVRVVGKGLDKEVDVEPATPPAPIMAALISAKTTVVGQNYNPAVPAIQAELTIAKTDFNTNDDIEVSSTTGTTTKTTVTETIDISTVTVDDGSGNEVVDLDKLAEAINNLDLDITAEVDNDNIVLKGLEDGTNAIAVKQDNGGPNKSDQGTPSVPEKELIQQEIEFGFTTIPNVLKEGLKVEINNTITGVVKSIDAQAKTATVKLDVDPSDADKVQTISQGESITTFVVTGEDLIDVIIPVVTGLKLQ